MVDFYFIPESQTNMVFVDMTEANADRLSRYLRQNGTSIHGEVCDERDKTISRTFHG